MKQCTTCHKWLDGAYYVREAQPMCIQCWERLMARLKELVNNMPDIEEIKAPLGYSKVPLGISGEAFLSETKAMGLLEYEYKHVDSGAIGYRIT